jgi:hypothetical protein
MPESDANYRGRSAVSIENNQLRVTVLRQGGHIAGIFDKKTGMNPLWTPSWPSIEPSSYDPEKNRAYGSGAEAKLLAGIMGHNLCLDIFGPPSPEEAAAGIGVHGEAPVALYDVLKTDARLTLRAHLPIAQIAFERTVELQGCCVKITESVRNLAGFDRPIGWTQHVTLGPPFLECGVTQFRASASRSKVFEGGFGIADYLQAGAEFDWPFAPRHGGGAADLRIFTNAASSSAYTAHLMDTASDHAFFAAFAPEHELVFGYVWKRADFPWMGIWEENRSRTHAPWNGETIARGMEFGVSPFPETRREMVDRRSLFGAPTYRWLPANGRLEAEYWAILQKTRRIPESLEWPATSTA